MFKRVARLGTAVLLLVALWPQVPTAYGVLGSCQADVDIHLVTRETQTRFAFTFDDVSSIQRITIYRPSGELTINGATGESWNASNSNEEAVFVRGGAAASVVYVDALSGSNDAAPADWIVTASDDIGGLDPIDCTGGNLTTEIAGQPPVGDQDAPIISNVSVSGITTTTATVSWLTNEPATTQINYGINELNDSFISDTLTTTHGVTLEGLQPGLVYYYYLVARDGQNNESDTNTNTFTTKALPLVQPGDISTQPAASASDKQPPQVVLNPVQGVFQVSPSFQGQATDNVAVAVVEYSVDEGKNWLPVETAEGLGTVSVLYSFAPLNLEDGDYEVIVRARDTANNSAISDVRHIVIDILDPAIGGYVIYMGSQQLYPDKDGFIHAVADTELQISLNAIGGANSVNVLARKDGEAREESSFSLVNNAANNLWQGTMKFNDAGTFTLTASSFDGGGNTSSRWLGNLIVQAPARLTNAGLPVSGATVSVYYQDVETKSWSLWDGAAYSQQNPMQTNENGEYGFFLPEGSYYLKIRAAGYREMLSTIFTLKQPAVIGSDAVLKKRPGFSIGGVDIRIPWPSFRPSLVINPAEVNGGAAYIDAPLPSFSLPTTLDTKVSSVSILGKPTVLSLVSTWSPTARQQISQLDALSAEQVNVVVVGSGESLGRLSSYAKLAGFDKGLVADSENALVNGLPSSLLPTTYFIDRQGTIKSMSSRVLSEQEIINNVPL